MTYWKSQEFKALQEAWYRLLKATGFEDHEEMIQEEMLLKQNAEHNYQQAEPLEINTRVAYYHFIAQKVQETVFTSAIDQIILVKHAEGLSHKGIGEELQRLGTSRNRNTIRYRIRLYEMKWGIRNYTPKQLNYIKVG